jgi:hypothetical protein
MKGNTMNNSSFRRVALLGLAAAFCNATDGEANQNSGAAPETKVTKTKVEIVQDKLTKARMAVAQLETELNALTKFDNIEVGGTVGFVFGRGEDKKSLSGDVTGVGTLDNGVAVVLVLLNKGTINAELKRIPKSTINAYVPPVKAEQVDLVAETQAAQAAGESPEALAVTNADSLLAGA